VAVVALRLNIGPHRHVGEECNMNLAVCVAVLVYGICNVAIVLACTKDWWEVAVRSCLVIGMLSAACAVVLWHRAGNLARCAGVALALGPGSTWLSLLIWQHVRQAPPGSGSTGRKIYTLVVGWPVNAIQRIGEDAAMLTVVTEPRRFGFQRLWIWDNNLLVFAMNYMIWVVACFVMARWIASRWSRMVMSLSVMANIVATWLGTQFLFHCLPA
jgi:hypothetical protein